MTYPFGPRRIAAHYTFCSLSSPTGSLISRTVLSFDPDGTLRAIEPAADATALDGLEGVEFYNGILVPADLLRDAPTPQALFDRMARNDPAGFRVGGRPGAVLIEGVDWPRMRPGPTSTVRRIL